MYRAPRGLVNRTMLLAAASPATGRIPVAGIVASDRAPTDGRSDADLARAG